MVKLLQKPVLQFICNNYFYNIHIFLTCIKLLIIGIYIVINKTPLKNIVFNSEHGTYWMQILNMVSN